jgi:hypothetical protein
MHRQYIIHKSKHCTICEARPRAFPEARPRASPEARSRASPEARPRGSSLCVPEARPQPHATAIVDAALIHGGVNAAPTSFSLAVIAISTAWLASPEWLAVPRWCWLGLARFDFDALRRVIDTVSGGSISIP